MTTSRAHIFSTGGDGKDGQFCIVLPEQDAVVAITAETGNMQAELNVVWDTLLPAFRTSPLAANVEEEAKLQQTLANLAVGSPASN